MGEKKKRPNLKDTWRAALDALEELLGRKELDWVPIPVDEKGRRRRRRAGRFGG
ncbi:MAG: hypothetical protein WBZ24_03915 [Anaerolineales bacterium]|jgi:hypothetical protein